MKRAIVSDIHGNLEAWTAVLEDIKRQGCDQIYCLGDVVGYGPDPCVCLDAIMQADVCILGNHDFGALLDPEGFGGTAEQAIFWTRQQLETTGSSEEIRRRMGFLARLPRTHVEGGQCFVHGSIRNPLNEYVFPEDAQEQRKMEKLFSMIQEVCFMGHTHVPGVFTEDFTFIPEEECSAGFLLGNGKSMINVGSVGQPRDGDWRSCYAIVEGRRVTFRRIEYDVDQTMKKILAVPLLGTFLAERLKTGR